MKKTVKKIMISLLAIFMCVQNIDIAFATNSMERSGTDKSHLFQTDSLKIYKESILIYDSNDPSVGIGDDGTTNQSLRIEFKLEWSQINKNTPEVSGGDYIIFDLFDIKTQGNELKNFSSTKNLLIDDVVVAIGELYTVTAADGTESLKYKVTFNDLVNGKQNIDGVVDGQFTVDRGNSNGGFNISVGGEKIYEVEIIPPTEKPGGGIPSNITAEKSKKDNGYNEGNDIIDPKWVIMFTYYLEHGIQEYRDSLNGITAPTYNDVIFEEILDANQTFESETSNEGVPNLDIQVPMVMNVLPSDGTTLITDGKLQVITRMQYMGTTLRNLTNEGVLARIQETDAGMSDNQVREDRVKSTPLTWTIVTDIVDGRECEHLIINFGKPGGDFLSYNKIIEVNKSKFKPFGETTDRVFNTASDVLDDLDKEITSYEKMITDHSGCIDGSHSLTNLTGDTRSCKYWGEYLQAVKDTKAYYASNPGVFGFRFYLRARLKDDEVSQNVSQVSNSFKITCGTVTEEDTASLAAKWNGTISMEASKGEVQLLKADSLYENDNSTIGSGHTDINGPLANIGFEVYDINDNKLHFTQENDTKKYVYDNTNSGSTIVYTNINGSLVIKGLENGKDYYFKEVDFGDGFYTGLNEKIPFSIDYSKPSFAFVENEARGVEFVKVDEKDNTIVLEGAEFTLHQENTGQMTGFTKKTINNKEYYVYDGVGTDNIFTTDVKGKVTIVRLPAGKYWFEETVAPVGYELSDEKFEFTLSKGLTGDAIYEFGNIKNKRILGSVSLTKVDAKDTSKTLSGAEFVLAKDTGNGNREYYALDAQGNIVWKANESDAETLTTDGSGIVKVDGLDLDEIYILIETKAPTGYDLPTVVADRETEFELDVDQVDIEKTFKNNATLGSITLKKVDADDASKTLAGAEFVLAREDNLGNREYYTKDTLGNIVWKANESDAETLTTDASGEILVSGLDLDVKYVFIETKAPIGYELPTNNETTVTLDVTHVGTSIVVENDAILGSIEITKVGNDTTATLEGAEFVVAKEDLGTRIYYSLDTQGNVVWVSDIDDAKVFTTDSTGKVTIDGLSLDIEYILIETKAPIGYELPGNNETKVTLDVDHVDVSIEIENEAILGSIDIVKVDANDNHTLEGAEFILAKDTLVGKVYYTVDTLGNVNWDMDVNNAKVFVTDNNGKINIDGLALNIEYTLIEIKAPIGYDLPDNNETKITLDVDHVNVSKEVKNNATLGSIEVIKVDADDNDKVLSGAEFVLSKENGQSKVYYSVNAQGDIEWVEDIAKAKTFVTNDEGKIVIEGLDLNQEYILIETKAPEGYELSENNEYKITLDVEHKDVLIVVENQVEDPGDVLGETEENEDKEKVEKEEEGEVLGKTHVKTSDDTKGYIYVGTSILAAFIFLLTKKKKVQ